MTIADSSAFSSYRAEVSRRGRLTRIVEHDLAVRYKGGDRAAARRLIEGCLVAVIVIALEYRRCGLPIEDLVQQGNLGLCKALERFDPDRGVRLQTYAAPWIRMEIRDYVARTYRVVRIGASKAERRALWLYRRTREDRPEELAAKTGLSVERARDLLPLLLSQDQSLSPPPGDEGPGLLERLADRSESAEAALSTMEERERLHAALEAFLAGLTPRDRDIARRRLLAEEPLTLEELGAEWGVTRERVRQLEEKLKSRMRASLEEVVSGPSSGEIARADPAPARSLRGDRSLRTG